MGTRRSRIERRHKKRRCLENEIPDSAVLLVVRHNKMISSLCRGAVIYITFLN